MTNKCLYLGSRSFGRATLLGAQGMEHQALSESLGSILIRELGFCHGAAAFYLLLQSLLFRPCLPH